MALVALLVSAVACSGDDGGRGGDEADDAPAGAATAPAVLLAAANRWAETASAHFELTAEGDTFLDDDRSIRLVSADGDLARPDAARATARIAAVGTQLPVKIVAIGEEAWLTNLLSGAWERTPDDFGYNPALLFDPGVGLGGVLTDLGSPRLAGEERVGDRAARRIDGTVSGERIREVTAATIRAERVEVAVWVDAEDADILRVTLAAPASAAAAAGSGGAEQGGGRWDLTFSGHGDDVEITAPV